MSTVRTIHKNGWNSKTSKWKLETGNKVDWGQASIGLKNLVACLLSILWKTLNKFVLLFALKRKNKQIQRSWWFIAISKQGILEIISKTLKCNYIKVNLGELYLQTRKIQLDGHELTWNKQNKKIWDLPRI